MLQKESDVPRSANARNCENTIQTGGGSTALATGRKQRRERYPATRENVELNFCRAKMFPLPRDQGD